MDREGLLGPWERAKLEWRREIVECGIDWISGTIKEQSRRDLAQLLAAGLIRREVQMGAEVVERSWYGYHLRSVPSVRFGERTEDCYVALASDVADTEWRQLAGLGLSVTRLDVQVTIRLPSADVGYGSKLYAEWLRRERRRGEPRRVAMIQTGGQGDTLYVGSRQSERFIRIYDKAAQRARGERGGLWRFEAELKGEEANKALAGLVLAADAREHARKLVASHLLMSGIVPPFLYSSTEGAIRRTPVQMDAARRLEWISRNVRPTVRRLLETESPRVVLDALGLSAYYQMGAAPDKEERPKEQQGNG